MKQKVKWSQLVSTGTKFYHEIKANSPWIRSLPGVNLYNVNLGYKAERKLFLENGEQIIAYCEVIKP